MASKPRHIKSALRICVAIFFCLPWPCSAFEAGAGYLPIDGADIYYLISRRGQPQGRKTLFFLHGGPGLDHSTFLPFLNPIKDYTLIFYDQRGCGRSEGRINLGQLKVEILRQDLETLRKHLGIQKLSVVAHGFGAVLALIYSRDYPDHVDRLFLISPMGLSDTYEEEFQERINAKMDAHTAEQVHTWKGDLMSSSLDTLDIAMTNIFRLRLPYQFYDPKKAADLNLLEFSNLAAAGFFYSLDFERLKKESTNITVPIMVVYGSDDPYPEGAYLEYAHYFPQAKMRKISKCGHYPFIEHPQQVKDMIIDFFE